jgi:hypothetical protein
MTMNDASFSESPLRFRLIHVFYVMALLGASLAACGLGGIVIAVPVTAWWYCQPRDGQTAEILKSCLWSLPGFVIAVLVLGCIVGLLFPAASSPRAQWRMAHCRQNLKLISVALQSYHAAYGSFPPAYVADANGKPMHSWRVLILPYLEEQPLYDQYRFDEPWDSAHNRRLLSRNPRVYQCPAHANRSWPSTQTSYLAISGPNMPWNGAKPRATAEFLDGTSWTLFVVEGPPGQIEWTEPRDLSADEAIELLSSSAKRHDGHHADDRDPLLLRIWGRNAMMADGSIRSLAPNQPRDLVTRLLNIADIQTVNAEELIMASDSVEQINWPNIFRFFVLTLVVLAPWFWRRRKPRAAGN